LTGYLPLTSLQNQWLENSDLGIFATVETFSAQAIYVLIILAIQWYLKRDARILNASPAR
jgi:hypothetical protein